MAVCLRKRYREKLSLWKTAAALIDNAFGQYRFLDFVPKWFARFCICVPGLYLFGCLNVFYT